MQHEKKIAADIKVHIQAKTPERLNCGEGESDILDGRTLLPDLAVMGGKVYPFNT